MNGKRKVALATVGTLALGLGVSQVEADSSQNMYRLYNPNSGEHFYTASKDERNHLAGLGWVYEGGAWTSPTSGSAVYRLYNPNAGDHHYTKDEKEKDGLVKLGWRYEGVSWQSGGDHPVYRLYNPNAKAAGAHHYTLSKDEYNQLIAQGWKGEGVSWQALGTFVANDVPASPAPTPNQPASTVAPRKVDENITTTGGGEGSLPGSYRLLYSNKPFDNANLNGTPYLEFSADVNLNGSQGADDHYGLQFIIAGNGAASGQIGLDISFQSGTSAEFAQNRLAVKTVNFPAGSGVHGEQFYSVNTSAVMNQTAKIAVQYFKGQGGEFVVTRLNGQVVGVYQTRLTTPNQYILHAQVDDWKGKNATLGLSNLQVKKNGQDITNSGAVNLNMNNQKGTAFNLVANTGNRLVQGAY